MELTAKRLSFELAESRVPVFVEFWASWCLPCKQVEPVLAQLAKEYGDKCRIRKINVDRNPAVAKQYAVQGLPTFVVFKAGKELRRLVASQPAAELRALIDFAIEFSSRNSVGDGPTGDGRA